MQPFYTDIVGLEAGKVVGEVGAWRGGNKVFSRSDEEMEGQQGGRF
ncbi:hypothetical protein GWI33_011173, partial [Rhynchophorus ferrugineus]